MRINPNPFVPSCVLLLCSPCVWRPCRWHRLHSKTGKKEKERGEVQVTVQFTRHNLTASMYDLSMKDKPHSAFGKLKERIRGKKRIEASTEDSASAIIPGGYGALARMRGRLPSDGGGEEYYEDDEGGEARRSKMRTFFLRGRLRKSSDTRSSTSLGSESSESSSRGGSLSPTAGISVVVSDLSNSPSNSSNLTADNSPEHTLAPSPQVSPHKRAFDDDVCEISIPVPQSFTYESLIPETVSPAPPSTAMANGHPVKHAPGPHGTKPGPQPIHVPSKQVAEKAKAKAKPKALSLALAPAVGSLQKASPISLSLQNLSASRKAEEPRPGPGDGRRWSLDKAGEEERAAIAAAIENAGKLEEEERMAAQFKKEEVAPTVAAGDGEVKKQKWGLFSHGRNESSGKAVTTGRGDTTSVPSEGKHKGWFGSKDSHSKPSCLVSQSDPGFDTTLDPSPFPISPDLSQLTPVYHTNPFTSPPPLSNANPFLSLLQQNPFFQEMYNDTAALTANMPALTCFSSSVPSVLLVDPSHGHECHVTEETSPGDANELTLTQEVTVVSQEGVFFNPFMSDIVGAQPWKPGDKSQTSMCPEPLTHTNPQTPNNTDKDTTGLTNTLNTLNISQLSPNISQTSLPQDVSMEFSEMHRLACPHPRLLEVHKDMLSHPETCLNKTSPVQTTLCSVSDSQLAGSAPSWLPPADQSPEMSGTPERPVPGSRGLQSAVSPLEIDLALREEADLATGLPRSAGAEVREMTFVPAVEQRMSAYGEVSSDDTLEASTIVSDSPGRELDCPADDPLPTCLKKSRQEFNGEQDGEQASNVAGNAEMKEWASGPVVDKADHVFFNHLDTTLKQSVSSSRVLSEFEGFGSEDVESAAQQPLNSADPKSLSSTSHVLDHSPGAESPFSGSLICILASSPGETLISPESRFTGDSTVLTESELPSSPTGVVKDKPSKDKCGPAIVGAGELETLHHSVLESPVSWPVFLSSDVNANSSVFPSISIDSDAYVSIGSDDGRSISNAFFSLDSGSICASGHDSRVGHVKDLLRVPQSTQLFNSLLFESAESEHYHTCDSQQRHRSLCSHLSLPLITAKDPMEQLIACYDLAVKTPPVQDPCPKLMQMHSPGEDSTSQLNLSPLFLLTSSPPTVPRSMSSPQSLPINSTTQEVISGHGSSLLIQEGNCRENILEKEDLLPDDLWKEKVMSEHWPSLQAMVARDEIVEPVPNYEFTEGVVPNSDPTQRDMPKSAPFQEVPVAKDGEMNLSVDGGADTLPRPSDSESAFSEKSGVQDLVSFPVDWASFDKLAVAGSTGENKEMSKAGAFILNDGWASPSSWFSPVAFEDQNDPNLHQWAAFSQVGSTVPDQSQPYLSEGMSNGTQPSSSISQDLVITHLHPDCPQTDMRPYMDNRQPLPDLSANAGGLCSLGTNGHCFQSESPLCNSGQSKSYEMDPEKHRNETKPAIRKDLRLTFKPATQSLSPLASSTPATAPFPLPFSATPPALVTSSCATPSPIASDMIGATQAVFPQENRQASNQIASPHPVKPLTPPGEERRSESRSVLEKLKSTINPGRSQDTEKKTLVEGGGSYYHLNHSELVSLLLQREADLQQERAEFERRGTLLEKREAELRKTRLLIRDLEDYIDRLLVRIMDEKPTLLQVRTKLK
ncbi:hypothetical protein ACEWY4_005246 [Coilia grayii]|uniref:FIP-RBD domain-containing protein n=1 Tax=Coilia grayii TaxID=363190 RepID=A0ABD1KIE3_9TELE